MGSPDKQKGAPKSAIRQLTGSLKQKTLARRTNAGFPIFSVDLEIRPTGVAARVVGTSRQLPPAAKD
jgi:hypothetical protein